MIKILPVFFIMLCFEVFAQPVITSFSPASGDIGTSVTITGSGFDPLPSNNIIFFGAVKGNVTAATGTSLTVSVPLGATYKPISVLNVATGLIAFSSKPFNITFSPHSQTMSTATFSNTLKIPFGPSSSTTGRYIEAGDIDADGRVDAILAPYNSASVYKNEFTGTFQVSAFSNKVALSSGNFLAAGDLDNTGSIDVVGFTEALGVASVTVKLNTSTPGNFSFSPTFSFASGLSTITAGVITDIDVDGKADIICFYTNKISILQNTSSAGILSFAPPVIVTVATNIRSFAFGDIDGDNKSDLAFTASSGNDHNLYIHRNIISGSVGPTPFDAVVIFSLYDQPPIGSTASQTVLIEDLDDDNKPEIIVSYSKPTFSIFKNSASAGTIGASSLQARIDINSLPSHRMRIADMDGDGKADIINAGPAGLIYIHRNDINGTIGTNNFPYISINLTSNTPIYDLQLADMTLDSRPDIIITDQLGAWDIVQNTLGVFPVSLGNFSGVWDNVASVSKLSWQTYSEFNTRYFIIERSSDSRNFEIISQVQAKGNTSNLTSYSFIDVLPFSNKNVFYRLKILDDDGQFTYSPIIRVSKNDNNSSFTIIKQTGVSKINIISANTDLLKRAIVNIYTTSGQKVAETRITSTNHQVNLGLLPKGFYTIIIYADGVKQIERLML